VETRAALAGVLKAFATGLTAVAPGARRVGELRRVLQRRWSGEI